MCKVDDLFFILNKIKEHPEYITYITEKCISCIKSKVFFELFFEKEKFQVELRLNNQGVIYFNLDTTQKFQVNNLFKIIYDTSICYEFNNLKKIL